jgi:hypothetical protein
MLERQQGPPTNGGPCCVTSAPACNGTEVTKLSEVASKARTTVTTPEL